MLNIVYMGSFRDPMWMEIKHGYEPEWLDQMIDLYNQTELKRSNKEKVNRAFQNSFATISCWNGKDLIGIGRMISDGEMYSGIYDVVVSPAYQNKGVGKKIMEALIAKAPETCIHLTSTFGNKLFYGKLGFKKHKTAFALYPEKLAQSKYLDHAWNP